MSDPRQEVVVAHFRRSLETTQRATADARLIDAMVGIGQRIADTLRNGGKVMLAGNGGSAADSQHIAAEFVGRFLKDRIPLPAIALTTDTSALTAIGNDYGFDLVFDRQLRALGRKGDVFIGISTSGRSPNVIQALKTARELGLTTVGFTKDAETPMHALCDFVVGAPSEETALIQQIHITAAHAICTLAEREYFAGQA